MNMLKIRLLIFLVFPFPFIASGVDPTEGFAKEAVTRMDAEYWRGIGGDKPPGGYLLRCEFDVTGDGRNEVFLAATVECEEHEAVWTVYSPDAQQNYTKIAAGVAFSPGDGFYLKSSASPRELQTVHHNPKFQIGIIDRYTIPTIGSVTHTKQELTAAQLTQLEAENWKVTFAIGDEIKPAVSKVLLAEYANNRTAQWRPYKSEHGVLGQNSDPADASAIAAHATFSVQTAKQLLGL
jgi:hypothetical protein